MVNVVRVSLKEPWPSQIKVAYVCACESNGRFYYDTFNRQTELNDKISRTFINCNMIESSCVILDGQHPGSYVLAVNVPLGATEIQLVNSLQSVLAQARLLVNRGLIATVAIPNLSENTQLFDRAFETVRFI